MLEVVGVTKSFGEIRALNEVSFNLSPGEVIALLGPNGSGKTTLLSIIAGLIAPDSGVLGIDQEYLPPSRSPQLNRDFGFAAQEVAVYPDLTTIQNLRFFSAISAPPRPDATKATARAIRVFQLDGLLHRKVSALSGGQQRRVHSAIAILGDPRIVILDEPSAGMDSDSRNTLLAGVRELAGDGVAVIYSTHYLAEVEPLAARLLMLVDGRIVADGRRQDLLAERSPHVEVKFAPGALPGSTLGYAHATRLGDTLMIELAEAGNLTAVANRIPDDTAVRSIAVHTPTIEQLYEDLIRPGDVTFN